MSESLDCRSIDRFCGLDILRTIAAFGIVGCHLCLRDVSPSASVVLSFCDLNVGLFAALSGFLMMKYCASREKKSIGSFVWDRFHRLVPVYVVWTIIYLGGDMCFDLISAKPLSLYSYGIKEWGAVVFLGSASCHLWFLICLFYTQVVLLPFCVRLAHGTSGLWMVVCFSLSVLIVVLSGAFSVTRNWFALYPLRLLGFYGLGCGLWLMNLMVKRVASIYCFAALSVGLMGHYLLRTVFYGFVLDMFVVIPAILCGLNGGATWTRGASRWRHMSELSMGVYLVHPIVTVLFAVVINKFVIKQGLIVVLCVWVLASGISYCVSDMASRWSGSRYFFR